jgi:hypothetical protein
MRAGGVEQRPRLLQVCNLYSINRILMCDKATIRAIQSAQAAGYSDWLAADEAALDYIATRIAPKFGVSAKVIAKRLRVEKLWPPTNQ